MRALRWSAFALINTAVVVAYLEWLTGALPPLEVEGRELVVVPVGAIALVVFTVLHPLVVRAETHLGRLALLLFAVAVGIAAYTGYLLARLGPPEPTLASAALLATLLVGAQVLYGAPLFAGLAALDKLLSATLVARRVRAWI